MPITVVNNNSLVSALQQTNPITINLPSAVDMSSVALQAAVEAEGWSQDANDAADRAEVAASALGETACEFHPRDYIPAAQMVYILNGNTDLQDEAVVTAGLRAMHDAMMAWVQAGGTKKTRIATAQYTGAFAINRELFSDTFAAGLWALPQTQNKFAFVAEGLAVLRVKNWADGVARVRDTGMWAGVTDPVPTALFRWEQRAAKATGPVMQNLRFVGTTTAADPIGFKGLRVNKQSWHNVEWREFGNTGKFIEGIVNSREVDCTIEQCGLQPTEARGSGWISSTVRFSVFGTAITATEPVFVPGHTGAVLHIAGAGPDDTSYSGVITYVDGTHATFASAVPTNVTGATGSFGVLRGHATAGSVTLSVPHMPTDLNMVGRYVAVIGAGGGNGFANLVTRVVGQTSDSLTLATAPQVTATNCPVILAPQEFVGITSDFMNNSTVALGQNDYQVFGQRSVSPDYWGAGTAVIGYYALANVVNYVACKWHGQSFKYNNYATNYATLIFDKCPAFSMPQARIEWGAYDRIRGSIIVSGGAAGISAIDATFGGERLAAGGAIFYVDPLTSAVAGDDWAVVVSGRNFQEIPATFVRFGAYGSNRNFAVSGAITEAGYKIGENPSDPPNRMRSLRAGSVGVGGEPSASSLVSVVGSATYSPVEFWRGSNRFLFELNSGGMYVGAEVSPSGAAYPIKVNWDAAENSIILTNNYAQIRKPRLTSIPSYANNAAALAGGLVAGETYQVSGSDPRQLAIVY